MRTLHYKLLSVGAAAALLLGAGQLNAQERQERGERGDRGGRGNFDPEQMRARMMERYREAFEVKDDAEWKLIEGRINKVMEARRDMAGGFGRGGFGGPGGRRGGGGDNGGGDGGERRRFGPEPSPEADALQKAIEAKASNDEIKAKLAKYRESQKTKQTALEKAQAELRQVLSVKQEANAVLMGLLS